MISITSSVSCYYLDPTSSGMRYCIGHCKTEGHLFVLKICTLAAQGILLSPILHNSNTCASFHQHGLVLLSVSVVHLPCIVTIHCVQLHCHDSTYCHHQPLGFGGCTGISTAKYISQCLMFPIFNWIRKHWLNFIHNKLVWGKSLSAINLPIQVFS